MSADDQVVSLSFPNGDEDFLRASDGSLLWHSSSPTSGNVFGLGTDNGLIYFSALDGGVDARRETSGMLLWHRPVKGNVLLIEKDMIYFSTANGSLNAMRGSDGMLLWHRVLSIPGLTFHSSTEDGVIYQDKRLLHHFGESVLA